VHIYKDSASVYSTSLLLSCLPFGCPSPPIYQVVEGEGRGGRGRGGRGRGGQGYRHKFTPYTHHTCCRG